MIRILLTLLLFLSTISAEEKRPVAQQEWEDMSPTPNGYDWIQLTSGEWLKGDFIAMYKEKVEFDSKEMDLLTFDLEDVRQIKTYYIQTINVEDLAILNGKLFMYEENVVLIMGADQVDFKREQIISIAHGGDSEKDYWSGKIAIGMDYTAGNNEKFDFNANMNIMRRTSRSRIAFNYLGVFGVQSNIDRNETVLTNNNQRTSLDVDYFQTKYFYFRPLVSEYYVDPFQNINHRTTAGIGLGYRFFDTKKFELDSTLGMSYKNTVYESASLGTDANVKSPSFSFDFTGEYKISKALKYKFNYSGSVVNKASGGYTHHMLNTLETEFIKDFDLDLSLIWDYVLDPIYRLDGTQPLNNDFRTLLSIGYKF